MKKRDTKNEIITIGTELIAINGYNATGIDAVLKQAGVPKGSFYHYFGSKEDFGLAVIDHFAEDYHDKLSSFLLEQGVSPLQRIRNYLQHSSEKLSQAQCSKGCLIGNLGQELADQNERFRIRLDEVFSEWRQLFSQCLSEAKECGELTCEIESDVLAEYILCGWEGAILKAKVTRSGQLLNNFINTLFLTVLK